VARNSHQRKKGVGSRQRHGAGGGIFVLESKKNERALFVRGQEMASKTSRKEVDGPKGKDCASG